jgi:tRNA threonylcarbamoyladenosine biosynthesis protein TsaB
MALMGEDGVVLAEHLMSPGARNFQNFMPILHDMLTATAIDPKQLKAVVVTIGPGSFTGLRVGLSAAKGMCQGLQIPVIGVSCLEAMASQLPYAACPICPIIDSRKGEVFAALFEWRHDHKIVRIKEDTCLGYGDLPSFFGEEVLYVGNDFGRQGPEIVKTLGPDALLAPASFWNLKASAVGTIGLKRFLAHDFDDLQNLVPLYLRPPDISPNPFPLISGAPDITDGIRNDMVVDK